MTEKIAVEVGAKNCFEKNPKIAKKKILNVFFDPFQKKWTQSET